MNGSGCPGGQDGQCGQGGPGWSRKSAFMIRIPKTYGVYGLQHQIVEKSSQYAFLMKGNGLGLTWERESSHRCFLVIQRSASAPT